VTTSTPSPAATSSASTATTLIDADDINEVRDSDVIIPEEKVNQKIKDKIKDKTKEVDKVDRSDTHKYYKDEFIEGKMWVDLDSMEIRELVKEHKMLSTSYRRAATIPLSFSFPFYGHNVTNITIATGGFLYTGEYVHAWLAATQYIAPLMANFDTSQSTNARIRYADNGTALIVEWEKVHLKDLDSSAVAAAATAGSESKDSGTTKSSPFSFQVILHKTGDIVFAYKDIPVSIGLIGDKDHPVKVGLSDAYIIDRTIFFVRRKTIYEYHRIDRKGHEISSSTAIYFRALATCNSKSDCQSCLNTKVETADKDGHENDLGCMWCPELQRCSDGMDRLRQQWLMKSCDRFHNRKGDKECDVKIDNNANGNGGGGGRFGGGGSSRNDKSTVTDDVYQRQNYDTLSDASDVITGNSGLTGQKKIKSYGGHYQAGIVTISIVSLMVLSLTVWFVYAYFFPHTWSGQLLIKYRPSHWQWRRAEPRYTAASIHM